MRRLAVLGLASCLLTTAGSALLAAAPAAHADTNPTMTAPSSGYLTMTVTGGNRVDLLDVLETAPGSVDLCNAADCADNQTASDPVAVAQGTAISLSLEDLTAGATYSSSDPAHAQITTTSGGYQVSWDDAGGDGDFNDLVVAVTVSGSVAMPPDGRAGSQLNGDHNKGETGQSCHTGEPVTCATGNLFETVDDLAVAGRGRALDQERTYNTLTAVSGAASGRFGVGWSDSYSEHLTVDSGGNVTVTQENGSTISFAPVSGGGYTAPARVTAALTKNTDGSYSVHYTDQTVDNYSSSEQLTSETDRNGYQTTLAYSGGQLTTVTDPAGRTLTYSYTSGGLVATVTDPLGRVVRYGYDGNGNLTTVTDPAGGVTQYAYDDNHRITSWTNPAGGVSTNAFNSNNQVVAQVDPAGRKTTLAYSGGYNYGLGADGGRTDITDPNGNVTRESFDANANLVSKVVGYGTAQAATSRYSYNPAGLVLRSTDPNTNATSYAYDAAGNLVRETDPLGNSASNTYSSRNDLLSRTDPDGAMTTYTRDSAGNVTAVTTQDNANGSTATTTYAYDPQHPGDANAVTDPTGRVARAGYDQYGDMTSTTDGSGNVTTFAYNVDGWRTSQTAPRGNSTGASPGSYTTSYTYDSLGRLTATSGPGTQSTAHTYDALGNQLSATDANHHTTSYSYDLDRELVKTTAPDGSTTRQQFDADGNLIATIDGLGRTTRYSYDALGRRISQTDALGRATTYGHDAVGNITTITDPLGRVTLQSYDADSRLVGKTYSDGTTPATSYQYNGDGQMVGMTDGSGSSTWTYRDFGRITQSVNGQNYRVDYTYDRAGRVTTEAFNGLTAMSKTYDSSGRINAVTDSNGNTTRFAYDADSNLTRISYGDGSVSDRTYDAGDAVTSIVDTATNSTTGLTTTLLNLPYARDAAEQLVSQNSTATPAPTQLSATTVTPQTITHDNNGRVTQIARSAVAAPVPVETYAYNAAGDLSGRGALTATDTLSYDDADELTSVMAAGAVGTKFTYNALGERITRTTDTSATSNPDQPAPYGYDQAGNLISYNGTRLSLNGETLQNLNGGSLYDGLNRRADLTYDEAASDQGPDGVAPILSDWTNVFVTGPGGMVVEQLVGQSTPVYLHSDQLGSTRVVTDSGAHPLVTFGYDAYGRTTTTPLATLTGVSVPSFITPIQYAGAYTDTAAGGLQYLRARWYDPGTGSFISVDPLAQITGQRYAYANGDPVDAADPTGLMTRGQCANTIFGAVFSILGSFCVVADDKGNVGIDYSLGGAVSTPQASVGVNLEFSDGNNIWDLGGPFNTAGGGVGFVSGAYSWGPSPCGPVHVFDVGAGLSVIPADAHYGVTTTVVHGSNWGWFGKLLFYGAP